MKLSDLQPIDFREASIIKNFIKWLGDKELSELTKPVLLQLYNQPMLVSSMKRAQYRLKYICARHDYDLVVPEKRCKQAIRVRYLKVNQIRKVMKLAAERMEIREWFIIAVETGLRRREIETLCARECNFENMTIDKLPEHTKTREGRSATMSRAVKDILFAYFGNGRNPKASFAEVNGVNGDSASHAIKHLLRKAGINDIAFHDLRHTFATYLYGNGVTLPEIQRRMGHQSINSTMIYTHVLENDNSVRKILDRLGT